MKRAPGRAQRVPIGSVWLFLRPGIGGHHQTVMRHDRDGVWLDQPSKPGSGCLSVEHYDIAYFEANFQRIR